MNNTINDAPCHLPDIDPTIDVSLCRPELSHVCRVRWVEDGEKTVLLHGACGVRPPLRKVPKGNYVCTIRSRDAVTVEDIVEERKRQNV